MATNFTNRFTAGGNTGLFTTLYGTCGTAAGTAAKTVTVDDFVLEAQARVTVKFTYANTVASPTLNVNSKGAKAIRWRGAALPSTQYWAAGQVIDFVYDGTYWNMIGAAKDNNTDTNYYHTPSYTSTVSATSTGGSSSNIKIATGTGVSDMYIPVATASAPGATIVYPAASCTTFSSDSGTVTPLAVQKGAKQFAITRPTSSTTDHIVRFSNTTGDVKDSLIKIEDVTNTKDPTLKKQVITIPAEGNKKMVYGYCTDQVDGTSFIGGVFPANATSYPYASGLAIGGTSGNLLWKGKQVATTDMIPTDTDTHCKTGLTAGASGTTTNAAVTNPYIKVKDDSTHRAQIRLVGSGATIVKSDANGNVTISSTNTDTKVYNTVLAEGGAASVDYHILLGRTVDGMTGTVNNGATESVSHPSVFFTDEGFLYANEVYGAVWNDYAEYRQSDCLEAGRVICENGDDTLSIATERLQPGAEIVSDTFGFAIGKTDKAQTPIAVSGRVLAYAYEDRNSYKPGDAVCAAPGGTVSKMTREEIREYPERIIGTVSAIPSYETWGTGNVPVNGRIWIKIK